MIPWIHFNAPRMAYLLWLVPVIALAAWLAAGRARRALKRVTLLDSRLSTLDLKRRTARQVVFISALAALLVGLTRPAWSPQPLLVRQEGRDVVFLVDVSRSMLAEDVAPSRLERARQAILDTIPVLGGNRIAVAAFAGSTTIICPLTRDYGFVRWAVEGLSPSSVEKEGTLIGDALRMVTADVLDPRERRFKDLILISDGEDQGSYPEEAAAVAAQQGVRIIAIGMGDQTTGGRIPMMDEAGTRSFLKYQGGEVWTRSHPDVLRAMALATPGGKFLNAGTGAFSLDVIYGQLIAGEAQRDLGAVEIIRYKEQFQILLALAFALLVAESIMGDQARPPKRRRI